MREKMIGTQELCKQIGVNRVTLYRWMQDDKIGFPKPAVVSRKHFWPESEVASFFAAARAA